MTFIGNWDLLTSVFLALECTSVRHDMRHGMTVQFFTKYEYRAATFIITAHGLSFARPHL